MPYSTDIKDYWRRSWGLEDRPTREKKSIPQQLTNLKNYGTNKYVKDEQVKYVGTRHPDWPVNEKKIFPEQQIKHKADKIVDKSYKNTKDKNPFTQAAGNAVKELSFKMKDGFIENNQGTARTTSVPEAIDINTALDENFQKQKEDDYLKKLKHRDYLKVSNPPILRNNINDPKRINPTVAKYKAFKEKQQKKIEDKKFDQQFKKDYSDQAMEKYVRGKVNKNIRAGKAPYEDLPSSYLIVGEHAKDKAKERLELYKKNPIQLPLPHIEMPVVSKEPSLPDFKTFLKSVAPVRDPDLDAGIAGLEEIKEFKKTADLADQKFPKKARGIGPFLSGEDD